MYNRQRRVPSSGRFTTEMSMTSKFCVDGRTLDPAPQSPGPHIAEVPNWGKILLYWLFRSKIWYFRITWLFTSKFFTEMVFFDAFWRAAVMSNIPNQGWNSAHILEGIYVSRYLLKLKYPYKILDLCTTPSFPLREKFPCIGMTRGITRLQKLS